MPNSTARPCRSRTPMIAVVVLAHGLVHAPLTARAAEPASDEGRSRPYVTPNDFDGTDVERINKAIRAAAAAGRRVVIPSINRRDGQSTDLWLLDAAILLCDDTTLELENCHIKLSDRCRDNVIRSANCGLGITDIRPIRNVHIRGIGHVLLEGADHPRATGDAGKKLGKRTYGTDAGVNGKSQTGDWRNIGILLAFVDGFSIENLTIKDSHAWAISLERCAHGRLRNLNFSSSQSKRIDGKQRTILNQDGIDLRLGCHDILIENITGHTGDDLVAMTAIPRADSPAGSTTSTMVTAGAARGQGQDDIRHVILRNVQGYCRGGHHIVRLLNTPGARLHDILIDGLVDTSPEDRRCKAAIKIGDDAYGGGAAPLGDTCRIIINNVVSRAKHTILIGGSLCDSVVGNIIRYGAKGEIITIASDPKIVRNLKTSNLHVVGP